MDTTEFMDVDTHLVRNMEIKCELHFHYADGTIVRSSITNMDGFYSSFKNNKTAVAVQIFYDTNFDPNLVMTEDFNDALKTAENLILLDIISESDIPMNEKHLSDLINTIGKHLIIQCYHSLGTFVYYKNRHEDDVKIYLDTDCDIDDEKLHRKLIHGDIDLGLIIDFMKLDLFGQFQDSNEEKRTLLNVKFNELPLLGFMYFCAKHNVLAFKYLLFVYRKLNYQKVESSEMFSIDGHLKNSHEIVNEIIITLKNVFANEVKFSNEQNVVLLLLLKGDFEFPRRFSLNKVDENVKKFVKSRNELHEMIANGNPACLDAIAALNESKLYLNSANDSALFTAINCKQYQIYVRLKANKLQFKNEIEELLLVEMNNDDQQKLKEAIAELFPKLKNSSVFYLLSKSQKSDGVMDSATEATIENYYKDLLQYKTVDILFSVIENCDYLNIIYDYNSDRVCHMNPIVTGNVRGATCTSEGRIYIGAKVEEDQLLGTIVHELTHLAMNIVFDNDCIPHAKSDTGHAGTYESIVKDLKSKYELGNLDEILSGVFQNYEERHWARELIVRVPQMMVKYEDEVESVLTEQANELYQFYQKFVIPKCSEFVEQSYYLKIRNTISDLNNYSGVVNNVKEFNIEFSKTLELDAICAGKKMLLLETPSTLLTLAHVYQSLNLSHSELLLFSYGRFKNNIEDIKEALKSPICNILVVEVTKTLEASDNSLDKMRQFLHINSSKKMILIENTSHCEGWFDQHNTHVIKTFYAKSLNRHKIESYSLLDFSDKTRKNFLDKKVLFQDNSEMLKCIVDGECEFCLKLFDAEILSKLLLNEKVIAIGKKPRLSDDYNDFYIKRSFKHQGASTTLNEAELVNKIDEFPIVLISDVAGMGKTTLLCSMSQSIKGYWLIRIDLNKFTDILLRYKNRITDDESDISDDESDISDDGSITSGDGSITSDEGSIITDDKSSISDDSVNFFVRTFLCSKKDTKLATEFEKNLLLHCIESDSCCNKNVILMFDGFDEISPYYKETVIDLISALRQTKIKQIWITTRPHSKDDLEDEFGSKSLNMVEISQQDQIDFLINYWTNELRKEDANVVLNNKLNLYAEMLVESHSETINDDYLEFTGIPFQTKMLAVAYTKEFMTFFKSDDDKPEMLEPFSLFDLYDKFIDNKFLICEAEKKNKQMHNVGVMHEIPFLKEKLLADHQLAGFSHLCFQLFEDAEGFDEFISKEERASCIKFLNDISNGSDNSGFITTADKISDDKFVPLFVHKTYAEYFASILITRKIFTNQNFEFVSVLFEIIKAIELDVCGSFLNALIGSWKVNTVDELLNSFARCIELELRDKSDDTALHICTKMNYKNLTWLLLNSFEFFRKQTSNFGSEKISDLCRNGYDDIVEKFSNKIQASDTERTLFREYVTMEIGYGSVLFYVTCNNYLSLLKFIINHCILIGIDASEIVNIPHYIGRSNDEVDEVDEDDCAYPLTGDAFSLMGYTALHFAAISYDLDVIDYLIDHCKSQVNGVDGSVCTPLQAAAYRGDLRMVKHLIEKHNADVYHVTKKGMNVLHYAAPNNDTEVFDYLMPYNCLNENGGERCLFSPIHVMAEFGLIKFIVHCEKKYNVDVRTVSADGRNAVHFAKAGDQLETVKFLKENYGLTE